jgi:hypothetical protein
MQTDAESLRSRSDNLVEVAIVQTSKLTVEMSIQLGHIYESMKAAEKERQAMKKVLTNVETGVGKLQVLPDKIDIVIREVQEVKVATAKFKSGPVIQESTRQLLDDQRRQIEGGILRFFQGFGIYNANLLNAQ